MEYLSIAKNISKIYMLKTANKWQKKKSLNKWKEKLCSQIERLNIVKMYASFLAQLVRSPPAMWETWVQFLVQEDLLEKEIATHSVSSKLWFSSSHVWTWELDHKEVWVPKNWCFSTVVLEKTLESALDCKEIKLVNPKGNQSWILIGRTDAEAEVKSQLIRKDPDSGKDWEQEEKGMTEDKMVGCHNWLNRHDSQSKLWEMVKDREGPVCCSPWGHKDPDRTEWLKNNSQYSCLGNHMHRGTWRATVRGVTEVGQDLALSHHHSPLTDKLSQRNPHQNPSRLFFCVCININSKINAERKLKILFPFLKEIKLLKTRTHFKTYLSAFKTCTWDNLVLTMHVLCVQSLSHVWLFVTSWTLACQTPLSVGFSRQ